MLIVYRTIDDTTNWAAPGLRRRRVGVMLRRAAANVVPGREPPNSYTPCTAGSCLAADHLACNPP